MFLRQFLNIKNKISADYINIGGRKGKSWWHITFNSSEEDDDDGDAGILRSFWKKFATGVKKRFSNLKTSFG